MAITYKQGLFVILAQDGARVHHKKKIPGVPWTIITQPTYSPDLRPLDHGIYIVNKIRLRHAVYRSMTWEGKVAMFKQSLQEEPVGPTIYEFKQVM